MSDLSDLSQLSESGDKMNEVSKDQIQNWESEEGDGSGFDETERATIGKLDEAHELMDTEIWDKDHRGRDGGPPNDAGNSASRNSDGQGKLVKLLNLMSSFSSHCNYSLYPFFKCHSTFTACTVMGSGVPSVKRNF